MHLIALKGPCSLAVGWIPLWITCVLSSMTGWCQRRRHGKFNRSEPFERPMPKVARTAFTGGSMVIGCVLLCGTELKAAAMNG